MNHRLHRFSLIFAWALYDLANQFFAINVLSLYFVRWITIEKGVPEIFYSISFSVSIFLVAVLSPVLGAMGDLYNKRRPFLIYLTLISVVFTMLIGVIKNIFFGFAFFIIANFGYQTATVFYNALMINITSKDRLGIVSGFGRMLGYSGAILAMYLVKPLVLKNGYQAAFFPSGFYFLIFALPCLIFIRDKGELRQKGIYQIFGIFKELWKTLLDSFRSKGLSSFLKAMLFSLCVVNVVILFMSVYITQVFELNEAQVINLVVFSTIFAILGSISSGFISDLIGYTRCLGAIFILWIISLVVGTFAKSTPVYWIVGAMVGTALGSIWVVSRALCMRLVPEEKVGEVFGLLNLVGSLSGIAGTITWGIILSLLSPLGELRYRIAFFSLNIFFIFAFIYLRRIKTTDYTDYENAD